MSQCVAVCCSGVGLIDEWGNQLHGVGHVPHVLQCVAVCCSVLQCVAVCYSVQCVASWCIVLQCVAVYCSVVLRTEEWGNQLHDVRDATHVYCSVLLRVAACCGAFQCVVVLYCE